MRRHQRSEERQRESVRGEMHAIVDRLVDALPTIEQQARDMGRGFPSVGDGARSRGVGESAVERIALNGESDPGARAAEALVEWDDWANACRRMDRLVRGLLPAREEEVPRGRSSSVELCAHCGEPIAGQVKRINGEPHHASSCYFRVWRAGRAS